MGAIESFGRFEVSRGADGRGLELSRLPDERVILAFDTQFKRLVELHLLRKGEYLEPEEKRLFYERATLAATVRRGSFVRIFDWGEDDEVVFYTSRLNDGESLLPYLRRRGPLAAATALSLALHLLDDLMAVSSCPLLFDGLSLDHVWIDVSEASLLQLVVSDHDMSQRRGRQPGGVETRHRLAHESCRVLFLMLVGKPYTGGDVDGAPAVRALPPVLRMILNSSLSSSGNTAVTLERMRDAVRQALAAQSRGAQESIRRHPRAAMEDLRPRSDLQEVLVPDVNSSEHLMASVVFEGDALESADPFAIKGVDSHSGATVTVQLLPPQRIVSSEHYEAVPMQMWRFNDERHPNILRSRSVWENPELPFILEERRADVSLSQFLAIQGGLSPVEAVLVLRQVVRGLEQAVACGVDVLDLHPGNITLRVSGASSTEGLDAPLLSRRLDTWPEFLVMLRTHMSMRSLYAPLLQDAVLVGSAGDPLESRRHRNTSLVALAVCLLGGRWHGESGFELPGSVSVQLQTYLKDCLRGSSKGYLPDPEDFVAGFGNQGGPEAWNESVESPEAANGGTGSDFMRATDVGSSGMVSDDDETEELPTHKEAVHARAWMAMPPDKDGTRSGVWAVALAVLMVLLALFVVSRLKGREVPALKAGPPAIRTVNTVPVAVVSKREPLATEEIRRAVPISEQERGRLRGEKPPVPPEGRGSLTLGDR